MSRRTVWNMVPCHCAFCGSKLAGFRGRGNMIQVKCQSCHILFKFIRHSRRPDIYEIHSIDES